MGMSRGIKLGAGAAFLFVKVLLVCLFLSRSQEDSRGVAVIAVLEMILIPWVCLCVFFFSPSLSGAPVIGLLSIQTM